MGRVLPSSGYGPNSAPGVAAPGAPAVGVEKAASRAPTTGFALSEGRGAPGGIRSRTLTAWMPGRWCVLALSEGSGTPPSAATTRTHVVLGPLVLLRVLPRQLLTLRFCQTRDHRCLPIRCLPHGPGWQPGAVHSGAGLSSSPRSRPSARPFGGPRTRRERQPTQRTWNRSAAARSLGAWPTATRWASFREGQTGPAIFALVSPVRADHVSAPVRGGMGRRCVRVAQAGPTACRCCLIPGHQRTPPLQRPSADLLLGGAGASWLRVHLFS